MNEFRPNEVAPPDSRFRIGFQEHLRSVDVDDGDLFPWRASRDPYVVLLAEVLLQRTRGQNVANHFQRILRELPHATRLARAEVDEIERVIAPLGLMKRAGLLKRLGAALLEEHAGFVPRSSQDLQRLPGVGPYGAGAVRCFAYGERTAIVDAGIARIIRRCLDLPTTRRVNEDPELWAIAESLLPRRGFRRHNLALLAVADRYCRVRPHCDPCPLRPVCRYGRKQVVVAALGRRKLPPPMRAS